MPTVGTLYVYRNDPYDPTHKGGYYEIAKPEDLVISGWIRAIEAGEALAWMWNVITPESKEMINACIPLDRFPWLRDAIKRLGQC